MAESSAPVSVPEHLNEGVAKKAEEPNIQAADLQARPLFASHFSSFTSGTWDQSFDLSPSDIDSVAHTPLFVDKVAHSLQTKVDGLPPSPVMATLPTPDKSILKLDLTSEDINDIVRTPLMISGRVSASTVQGLRETPPDRETRQQSTPLSAKDKSVVVDADEGEIKPRRLMFDDDEGEAVDENASAFPDHQESLYKSSSDVRCDGLSQSKFDERERIVAATKIQATWRGYAARKLYKEACAYADELIARALSKKVTDLEPIDFGWCYPEEEGEEESSKPSAESLKPVVFTAVQPEPQQQQKVPVVVAKPSIHRRASSSNITTSGEPFPSTRESTTTITTTTAGSSKAPGGGITRKSSSRQFQVPSSNQSGAPVVTVTQSSKATPQKLPPLSSQSSRRSSGFQSTNRGMMSECCSPSGDRSARVQQPLSARQPRTVHHTINRSESCLSLSRQDSGSVTAATSARAQRLLGQSSTASEQGSQPAFRSQRVSSFSSQPPKWNFY